MAPFHQNRRQLLRLAAGASALSLLPSAAWAQAYPSRPVRLVVGFSAGGANDLHARVIAEWLSKTLDQPFIVENRPGATGNIGLESVVRARPDGYTLSVCGSSEMRGEILFKDLKFSFVRDTTPVAIMTRSPNVLVVNPALSAKSVPELIALAKAKPGALVVASAGVGSTQHVFYEMFNNMTGARMLHVPYHGASQALTDLLGQQVQVYFSTISDVLEHVKAGRLRALAVTGSTRIPQLPDVPTVGEFVPGYEAYAWLGMVAPKGTPAEIIDKLNRAINAGLSDPKLKQKLADWGDIVFATSPAGFKEFIAAEHERWSKVIQEADIKI